MAAKIYKYENIEQKIIVVKKKGQLIIQYDEMWSFVKIKNKKSGFGSQLMWTQNKLWGYMLAASTVQEPKDFGIHCRRFIDNVLLVIQIFGQPAKKFFQLKGTKPQGKRAVKQTTLKDLTVQCGKEFFDL